MIAVTIANILKEKLNIAVISHINPDGDSIGSMLALYNVLKCRGKNIDVYCSDEPPYIYSFLPGFDIIKNTKNIDKKYDVLVVLDCGSLDRTGGEIDKNIGDISINIDHHMTNSLFADLNLVDTNASATGELIYQILKLMGKEIMQDEALCIYTAILTDTGGFRYTNTTSITHTIAGDLINTGINFGKVYDLVFRNYEYKNIKILGNVLKNIELFNAGSIALIHLNLNELEGYNINDINTSDFINYARDINSVEVAAFIKEISPGEFRVNMRSKSFLDVRLVCEKHGGGGHIRAAGCTMIGNIAYVKDTILNELQERLKDDEE